MKKLEPATTALLLIDVINHFDFDGSEQLLHHALPAARRIADLKKRLRAAGIPAIYVNDNFGRWQSDFRDLVDCCVADDCKGREIAGWLKPEADDYFVLKPKHSGFYSTSLSNLLGYLGTETIILTGFAGDICVIYTANDAYMRDYHLVVPSDCVASESADANVNVLDHMRKRLKAEIVDSTSLG